MAFRTTVSVKTSLNFYTCPFVCICMSISKQFHTTKQNYWKSMLTRLRGSSNFATSTRPTMKSYAPTADHGNFHPDTKPRPVKGEFVPVYVAVGMIVMSLSFGVHTAWQQLRNAPNVQVRKSRRETLAELEDPDHVVEEADKFIKRSFFRKVAHVQDYDRQDIISDPIRGDAFAKPVRAETLKSVGIDPKGHK